MTTLSLWNESPLFKNFFSRESEPWLGEVAYVPPCDIEEKENCFLISMDIPGMKKEDFDIQVNDEVLTISGTRKQERKAEEKGFSRSERFTGKFERAFSLGEKVYVKKIEASYEEGVLKVLIPREKEVKPEVIKIKVGEKLQRTDTH